VSVLISTFILLVVILLLSLQGTILFSRGIYLKHMVEDYMSLKNHRKYQWYKIQVHDYCCHTDLQLHLGISLQVFSESKKQFRGIIFIKMQPYGFYPKFIGFFSFNKYIMYNDKYTANI